MWDTDVHDVHLSATYDVVLVLDADDGDRRDPSVRIIDGE